jgi:serine/threonine protein phosphatase 1
VRKKLHPQIPDGVRIYAIGDIHGRADLLNQVLTRIEVDLVKNPVNYALEIYLGDYIDRGPASKEVLDVLVLRKRTRHCVFLKGNHETYLLGFLANPALLDDWRSLGGFETLMSYGITPVINADTAAQTQIATAFSQVLPERHRQFLADLKSSYSYGEYFFVHAGVRPGIPLENQRTEDLLQIREDFLFCEEDFSKIVVHGHTPVREPDIRSNRINIDTGAYATGQLTCLILESGEIDFI